MERPNLRGPQAPPESSFVLHSELFGLFAMFRRRAAQPDLLPIAILANALFAVVFTLADGHDRSD
jgi:hypothetical protein